MKNISLKDAVDIAAKLDLLTRNKTIDPFISVNLFSANAEDEVASRQDDHYSKILDLLKAHELCCSINAKVNMVKVNSEILALESELDVATKWLVRVENYLEQIKDVDCQSITTPSSISEASAQVIKFTGISTTQQSDLIARVNQGKVSVNDLKNKINELVSVNTIEISQDQIDAINSVLPEYKII